MNLIFVFAILWMGAPSVFAASTKIVSDSLVQNLRCDQLTLKSVLQNIRPTAFGPSNHLPARNWEFRSRLSATLGVCWGLSSTQRKAFYLVRTNHPNPPPLNVGAVLDMIRGEKDLIPYSVIPLRDQSLYNSDASYYSPNRFYDSLVIGVPRFEGRQGSYRNFRTEVERAQELHFFRGRNLKMGLGSGPLSERKNRETLRKLLANLRLNRLTLLNLRLKPTIQHVVVAKSFRMDSRGNYLITAYDSNHPERNPQIYFAHETSQFYAPQIMGAHVGDLLGTDYRHPLGTFIVDEEERGQIETALLKHYQQICR